MSHAEIPPGIERKIEKLAKAAAMADIREGGGTRNGGIVAGLLAKAARARMQGEDREGFKSMLTDDERRWLGWGP